MKKLLLAYLVCISVLELSGQDYKVELLGKMLPAKVKYSSGETADVFMKYQTYESFKNPQNKFTISATESEAGARTQQGGIDAFVIDGNIWALRQVPVSTSYSQNANQFVILRQQGAIERYEFVKYGKPSDPENHVYMLLPGDSRTGFIARKTGTKDFVAGPISSEKVKEWIADSPEVMDDLKKAEAAALTEKNRQDSIKAAGGGAPKEIKNKGLLGAIEKSANKQQELKDKSALEIDMNRIINNYNAWYNEKDPGKTTYIFDSPATWRDLPRRQKSADEIKAERDKAINALFANRTSTVAPDMASSKANVPVKKETFAAKLNRIKGDGNKVGVLLYLNPVRVNPPASTGMMVSLTDNVNVAGSYMDESLKEAAQHLVSELNQSLGTSDIELIDINKIPYRDVKVMGMQTKVDDFWATKYKVVFAYTLDPQLKTSHEEIGGKIKFAAYLNMITSLIVTEYIGDPASVKRDIHAQVLNMGSFVTPTYAQEEDLSDIKQIYDKALEKLGTPLLEKMKSERADAVKKLVEKKLAP